VETLFSYAPLFPSHYVQRQKSFLKNNLPTILFLLCYMKGKCAPARLLLACTSDFPIK